MVKAEGGRQFFIDASCGVEEPVRGLRVLLRELSRVSGPARAEIRLPPGGRHIVELDPVQPKTKKKPAVKRTRKKIGGDGAAPKKRVPKGVVQRVKRKGEALERDEEIKARDKEVRYLEETLEKEKARANRAEALLLSTASSNNQREKTKKKTSMYSWMTGRK